MFCVREAERVGVAAWQLLGVRDGHMHGHVGAVVFEHERLLPAQHVHLSRSARLDVFDNQVAVRESDRNCVQIRHIAAFFRGEEHFDSCDSITPRLESDQIHNSVSDLKGVSVVQSPGGRCALRVLTTTR